MAYVSIETINKLPWVVVGQAINKALNNGFSFTSLLSDIVTTHVKNVKWHVTAKHVVLTFDVNTFDDTRDWDNRWVLVPHRRMYTYEQVLYNKWFAMKLWGDSPYYKGQPVLGLLLTCTQVAIRVFDELHAVDRNINVKTVHFQPELIEQAAKTVDLADVQTTEYKLEEVAATVPIETHHLTEIDFSGTIPAYTFHTQQMVIADDSIAYLGEHI